MVAIPLSAPIALILGILLAVTIGNPYPKKVSKYTSLLLKTAIVGLGFGLNIDTALEASSQGLLLTVITIVSALLIGFLLSKYVKISSKLTYLISAGTAICGGSAIAAVAPAINADENDISLSLAIVFTLNAIALLVFPFIGEMAEMSQVSFGTWAAVAIHDTSSVVGAAKVYGEEALEIATSVKLARTLWIIPLVLISSQIFKGGVKKLKFPIFILFFIAAILLGSHFSSSTIITDTLPSLAKRMMVLAIFLTGLSLSYKNIKKIGPSSIIVGALLWLIIAIGSFFWIEYLF